ncbi:MAG TPA: ABC transporter permease [Candidatus Nanoarchaeia archaeon]|nr:ABC transporter permease [Candidatus Nanoarchaeia archaeon]
MKNRWTGNWIGNWISLQALAEREIKRIFRVWTQTIIPPIITAVLFIVIFGYSLGSRVTEVQGVSYLEFIIPGLLMMGVIMSAYANTSFSLFIARFHNMHQEWLSAPITYWQIIISLTIGGLVRGFVVGILILAVSLLATTITIYSIATLLFFIIMASLLFSFAGILTALWATNFDKLNVFTTFLITPLTYLGGVFYSTTMLPPFWATVAKFNPILYIIDGFRFGFIGLTDVPLWTSIIILSVLTLISFAVCVHLFKKGYHLKS